MNDTIIHKPVLSLDECISLALEYNLNKKISTESVNIARSQLMQAESALYPGISFNANISYLDEDIIFLFPEQTYSLDMPPIPGVQFKGIKTEAVSATLLDNKNIHAQLSLKYPLYTGGKISSINQQARKNLEIAEVEVLKEESEIIYNVTLYYFSHLLASSLFTLCSETSEILDATLSLTENLYLNGSGRVTKIDYLKNKVIVDQVKSYLIEFEKNYNKSKEALIFITGNKLNHDFVVSSFETPYRPVKPDMSEIEKNIYRNNPDWIKMNSAIDFYKAKSDEVKSQLLPNIGLFANFDANYNKYQYGLVNKNNRYLVTIGLGIDYDIFSGFRTKSAIEEADAGFKKINLERDLLNDALKLQLKNIFYELSACEKNIINQSEALKTAEENRKLTERAFQQEMADADELIQAQIMEALIKVQYQKALYEYEVEKARLQLISGIQF